MDDDRAPPIHDASFANDPDAEANAEAEAEAEADEGTRPASFAAPKPPPSSPPPPPSDRAAVPEAPSFAADPSPLPAPPATAMSSSAIGASYGDLLAPPPSYADSVMYSRPPDWFASSTQEEARLRDAARGGIADGAESSSFASRTGMMNTVALDFGSVSRETAEEAPPDSAGAAAAAGALAVFVTDPQMSLASSSPFGKKVVTYKVQCATTFPEYETESACVWRRFRDFVALADRLQESHKGYFVPPRPEKRPLSGTDDAFVRDRVVQLQAYLERLARHPALRRAKALRVFLTAPDLERNEEWLAFGNPSGPLAVSPATGAWEETDRTRHAVSTMDASAMRATAEGGTYGVPPGAHVGVGPSPFPLRGSDAGAGGGSGVWDRDRDRDRDPYASPASPAPQTNVGKFLNRLSATVSGALVGLDASRGGIVEDDTAFMEERDRVFRLEQELAIASLKVSRALEYEEKFSDALGELGLECVKLAKLEDTESVRRGEGTYTEVASVGRDTALRARKMGNAAVRVSRLTRQTVGQLSKSLRPLHEYLSMMPAVRRAVQDRSDTLFALQRASGDLESKKARLARLETDITKMLKVDLLKREVHEARRAAEAAAAERETIKKRQAGEFFRLEKNRCASFKRMWLAFARTQVTHAERALQVWRALAEDLGASPEEWGRGDARSPDAEGSGADGSPRAQLS
jgi:sorting nexin-1/2